MEKIKINGKMTLEPKVINESEKSTKKIKSICSKILKSQHTLIKQNRKNNNLKINNKKLPDLGNLGWDHNYDTSYNALSIITNAPNNPNGTASEYKYSPLFHEDYNGLRNRYPNTLFRNYTSEGDLVYGNVWIQLTGNNASDYAAANYWAINSGLYDGYIPDSQLEDYSWQPYYYTWHHVYMGWFTYNGSLDDGWSTTSLLTNLGVSPDSTSPFDASNWANNTDNWEPFENWSIMQLVRIDAHEACYEHLGSTNQYCDVSEDHSSYPLGQPIFGYYDNEHIYY